MLPTSTNVKLQIAPKLPANVAAAVNPEAEYGKRANGEWVAVARYPDERFVARAAGAELVGLHLLYNVRVAGQDRGYMLCEQRVNCGR